jgi:hypothetical protein
VSKTKAKSNAKSKSKAKKADSGIPKKVAGVKMPKAVQGGAFATLFSSDLGREILADALIAAAGAAAAALTRTRAAKNAGSAAMDAGSTAASIGSELMQTAAGAVAGVVTDTAKNLLPANLLGGEGQESKGQGRDSGTEGGENSMRQRYAHLATDHNVRKTSKPTDKGSKPGKR